ncbi:MAG: adenosylmethionine decarboxylase [Pseudomonadota bacterium]
MSRKRALFQWGMDLDPGSSTAQREEASFKGSAKRAQDGPKDYFSERDGVAFAGRHLIIDLIGAQRLDDLVHVEAALRACVTACGATLLHLHLHPFSENGGISGVAVLAESHISVHTWPERAYGAFDVFMCGAAEPQAAVPVLREYFAPERVVVEEHQRGRGA